jgi:group I intron endonuclease
MALVYKATNLVNGKCYIGITRNSLKERQNQHKSRAKKNKSNCAFHHAIRKHGWDSFVWEVIEDKISLDQIAEKEIYYINKYNSFASTKSGYNRTAGGLGVSEYEFTKDQKFKIAVSVKTDKSKKFHIKKQLSLFHQNLGKVISDETKEKIKENMKKRPLGVVPSKLHFTEYPIIKVLRNIGYSYKRIGNLYNVRAETVYYFCKRRELRPT